MLIRCLNVLLAIVCNVLNLRVQSHSFSAVKRVAEYLRRWNVLEQTCSSLNVEKTREAVFAERQAAWWILDTWITLNNSIIALVTQRNVTTRINGSRHGRFLFGTGVSRGWEWLMQNWHDVRCKWGAKSLVLGGPLVASRWNDYAVWTVVATPQKVMLFSQCKEINWWIQQPWPAAPPLS